jgi:hypothetical protein
VKAEDRGRRSEDGKRKAEIKTRITRIDTNENASTDSAARCPYQHIWDAVERILTARRSLRTATTTSIFPDNHAHFIFLPIFKNGGWRGKLHFCGLHGRFVFLQ